jgi:rSAM/selenodomain-associated transferase 2
MRVGVVIPTLDEEEHLARGLPAVLAAADQVVVSDGGSRDGTLATARSFGLEPVTGPAARGGQLNRGAAALDTEILLFLHADTTLPPGAVDAIRRAIADGHAGGGFLVRFDSRRPLLRLGGRLVNLRTRLTRSPLGDQAQFVRRELFAVLGGFRDWPILEDLDFITRLRRRGTLALLPGPVTTSARRFARHGVARTVATNWLIWALYLGGLSPTRLARLYRHVR